jgi:hypothetical protein
MYLIFSLGFSGVVAMTVPAYAAMPTTGPATSTDRAVESSVSSRPISAEGAFELAENAWCSEIDPDGAACGQYLK